MALLEDVMAMLMDYGYVGGDMDDIPYEVFEEIFASLGMQIDD